MTQIAYIMQTFFKQNMYGAAIIFIVGTDHQDIGGLAFNEMFLTSNFVYIDVP